MPDVHDTGDTAHVLARYVRAAKPIHSMGRIRSDTMDDIALLEGLDWHRHITEKVKKAPYLLTAQLKHCGLQRKDCTFFVLKNS